MGYIGHELQHVCWKANGLGIEGTGGYYHCDETLATLAEYFLDSFRPRYFDNPYDASMLRSETCDLNSKYDVEKVWISYLYETFKGNPSDPTDDLIYRWIRAGNAPTDMKFSGLSAALWDSDFDWLGGANANDRLNKVFSNFLVAKFANAPGFAANSRFGVEGLSTFSDFFFFEDNCDFFPSGTTPMSPVDCPDNQNGYPTGHGGCWNVRILPPTYELSSAIENTMANVEGIYEDGDDTSSSTDGDGSTDYIDVSVYGTDYILFRSGSYFEDGEEHEFRFRVGGKPLRTSPSYGETWRIAPIAWVLGYCCEIDTPQVHAEHLVFVEPIRFSPETTLADTVTAELTVTDFGRSIRTVVVAVSAVLVNSGSWTASINHFIERTGVPCT